MSTTVKNLLRNEIYPRLRAIDIFGDLEGVRETGYGILANCPSCGAHGKFTASNNPEYPFGRCYRANKCGYTISWWDHVRERFGLTSNKEVLETLAEMAKFQLPRYKHSRRDGSHMQRRKHPSPAISTRNGTDGCVPQADLKSPPDMAEWAANASQTQAKPVSRATRDTSRTMNPSKEKPSARVRSTGGNTRLFDLYSDFFQMCRNAKRALDDKDFESVPPSAFAMDNYLSACRKWPEEWLKKGLDVVPYPGERKELMRMFASKGYSQDLLKESGLFRYGWGEYYNALLPYRDDKDRVVAFVGVLHPKGEFPDGSAMPKYMGSKNISGQSSYKDIPYGLAAAKSDAMKQGEVILVEGYFDRIMFSRSGFRRCVAVGTNRLTGVQAEFLLEELPTVRRYVFALDNDVAGRKGVIQSVLTVLGKHGGEHVSFFVLVPPIIKGVSYKDFDDARQEAGFQLTDESYNPVPFTRWVVDHPLYGDDSEYQRDRHYDVLAGLFDRLPEKMVDVIQTYAQAQGMDIAKIATRTKAGKAVLSEFDQQASPTPRVGKKVSVAGKYDETRSWTGDERKRNIPGFKRMLDEDEAYELLCDYVRKSIEAASRNDLNRLGALARSVLRRKDLERRGAGKRLLDLAGKISKARRKWHFQYIGEVLKAEARRIIAENQETKRDG